MKSIVLLTAAFSLVVAGITGAAAKSRKYSRPAAAPRIAALHADPYAVYVGGTYAGRDPDPNIRAQLIREFGRQSNK